MVAIIAVLLHFYGKLSERAERFASITGKGYRPRPFRLGSARWIGAAVVLCNFLIVLVLPLAAILWMAITPFMQPLRVSAFKGITLENFVHVFSDSYYRELAFSTVVVASSGRHACGVPDLSDRVDRGTPQVWLTHHRPTCDNPACVSGHCSGHCDAADRPECAVRDLWNLVDHYRRIRDPLRSLWNAIFIFGCAANSQGTGAGSGCVRREHRADASKNHRAAPFAGTRVGLDFGISHRIKRNVDAVAVIRAEIPDNPGRNV